MEEIRLIQPKRPKSKVWQLVGTSPVPGFTHAEIWRHPTGLNVLTNVETPDQDIGPEYHVSVTMMGRRCTSNEAMVALKAFDMEYSDEDNHTAIARNYWQPVADSKAEYVCPCKETEPAIKMDKGDFIYRPLDAG